nr:metal ABC transporter substrate-binding protein [Sedimentibacter sp.]
MKKLILILLTVVLTATVLFGCTQNSDTVKTETGDEKLNVVTTLFPYYDFVRAIAGDKVNVTMIVPAGMDTHSFEPTPANMITIQNADVFIYNGGEMESWVDRVLGAVENENQISDCMIDYVNAVEEETVEGMEPEDEEEGETDEDEVEYDEHIWTSPVNAQIMVEKICNILAKADSENAEFYQANADSYIEKLKTLDEKFKETVDNSKRKLIVFGDKFPFRYFADEYGLKYSAAFNGCSTETEPSADTVAYLIDKVKAENIPVVYYIELSNEKIADTICEATGAKKLLLHSCHNLSKKDFDSGITYVELMEQNVKNLKEGLN